MFLVAGVVRPGFITQFLSKPVMDGFVMGLAVFVAVGQLKSCSAWRSPMATPWRPLGIIQELPGPTGPPS